VQGGTARAALELAAGSVIPEPIQLVMHNHADHTQLRNHSGHNTLTGQLSLNAGGGRWDIAATGGSLTLAGPLVNVSTGTDTWRTLHLHGPAGGTITGNLTNSASGNSLTNVRVQSGAWELSGGAKSYTGATTVAGGSLTVHAALVSPVTVLGGATVGGNGSTTGDLTLHDQARLRVRVDDWDAPPVGFTAARLLTGSASLLTVTIDATGILGFTETPRSIPLVTTTAETPTPPAAAVAFETGAFPGSGTWSLAVAGSQLILAYQPDPYAAWTAGIDWQGEDSGPLADPERDGLPNLLEFALGGDPLVPDTGIAPRPWLAADGRLAITFWRRADPALHYQVEAAASPAGPWLTVWASTGPANTAGPVTVADVPPPGTPPARFLRLRVTR
nr:hypothetical protein [Akkermansiaceae bacterium]